MKVTVTPAVSPGCRTYLTRLCPVGLLHVSVDHVSSLVCCIRLSSSQNLNGSYCVGSSKQYQLCPSKVSPSSRAFASLNIYLIHLLPASVPRPVPAPVLASNSTSVPSLMQKLLAEDITSGFRFTQVCWSSRLCAPHQGWADL